MEPTRTLRRGDKRVFVPVELSDGSWRNVILSREEHQQALEEAHSRGKTIYEHLREWVEA